ncbi:zinc finger protein 271-like [Cydia fagiglandana]|uniref:zinc finger protein 271-like n=1 Tax=Cydia fagiglandana TaxID=1458189 RepID=UPI002FEE5226
MSDLLESADCVKVKAEPSWDLAEDLTGHIDHVKTECDCTEEDVEAAQLCNDHKVKEEIKNEQVEPIDQDIKAEELVLDPEEFQRPKVTLVCRGSQLMPSQTCSVRLEQMHVDMQHHTCTICQNTYKFQQYFPSYDNCTDEDKSSINKLDGQAQHITNTEHPGTKSSRNKPLIHQKTLVGEKLYKCDLCNYSSINKFNFNRHELKHYGEKPYKCAYCSYTTMEKSYLKEHYENYHTGNKVSYKCTRAHCAYTTDSKSDFDHHYDDIHPRRKPYKCKYCRYAASEEADIRVHETIHNGINPYKCAFCDYTTSYKRSLKVHQMIHNGGNPYKCARCSYITFRESNLKQHERTHNGVKPEKMEGKVG